MLRLDYYWLDILSKKGNRDTDSHEDEQIFHAAIITRDNKETGLTQNRPPDGCLFIQSF